MRRFVLWGPAAAVCAVAACGGAPPVPYKPIADTKLLMQAMVDPSAVKVWQSVKYVVTADGEEQIKPETDEEWLAIRNAALTVSESGNLLLMPPRAQGGDWTRVSLAMIGKANELKEAAEKHDVDKIFTAGGDLYDICTNCHVKYMKQPVEIKQ